MAMLKSRMERIGSTRQTIGQALPKVTASHYGTSAHKSWSAQVIKRAGYQCEAIDASGHRCIARGKLYADHIAEIADRPDLATDFANGQALCSHHHGIKTAQARAQRQGDAHRYQMT